MKTYVLILITLLSQLIFAAPTVNNHARDVPIKPSDDPFYSPPSGFEDQPLGSILRIRKKENSYGIVLFAEHVDSIYQILVRSEDTFNQPIAVVTTLFVPFNADPTKLLSYQIAEDASSLNCAPSYAMQLWSSPSTWVTSQIEQLLIIAALKEGYYVTVPDHEGPKATYIVGWTCGYAVLNSIKATLNSANETGIDPDAEVVMWGYSGGGFATAWGSQLAPSYFPDLKLLGAAMGGIPVNISHVATNNMGTYFAGLVVAAINGLSHEYPDLDKLIKENIKPGKYDNFTMTNNLCLLEYTNYFEDVNFSDYFDVGEAVMNYPVVKNITDTNNLLTTGNIPECPIFIYSSENDEIIPIEDTDALYELYCSQGVSVEYRKDTLSEHVITAVSGAGLAFNFVRDRFNGVPVNPKCQTSNLLSNIFADNSWSGLGDIGSDALAAIMGEQSGPASKSQG